MYCPRCGAKNDDAAKFCYQCGNQLGNMPGKELQVNQNQPELGQPESQNQPETSLTENQNQSGTVQPANEYQPGTSQPVNQQPAGQNQPMNSQPINQGQMVNQGQSLIQTASPAYSQPQVVPYGQFNQDHNPDYQNSQYQNQQYSQYQTNGQKITTPKKSLKPFIITFAALVLIAVVCFLCFKTFSKSSGVLDNVVKAANGTVEAGSFKIKMSYSEDYGDGDTDEKQIDGIMEYDLDKSKLNFDLDDGEDQREVLYDGVLYTFEDGEYSYSDDISEGLDTFFKYYKDYKGGLKGLSKVDWKDAIDDSGLSSYVDSDKIEKCISKFEKNLNSKDYFKKVCKDFSVKKSSNGTTYTFDVDVPKLVESLLDTFKPAIDYNIDDVKDRLLKEVDIFDKFLVEITVKGNKVNSINVEIKQNDDTSYKLEVEISNYGKVSVDKKDIEDYIGDNEEDE